MGKLGLDENSHWAASDKHKSDPRSFDADPSKRVGFINLP